MTVQEVDVKLDALAELKLPVVYIWQGDDSRDAYDFLQQMVNLAGERGGRVVLLRTYQSVDVKNLNGECSPCHAGKFIYVED